jgi:SAM-dependent methyltransferase
MEQWYADLLADPSAARRTFTYEYAPFRPLLADLYGTVLDLGGGNGLVRHFLPDAINYVSVDPSLAWCGHNWQVLADAFPCLKTPLHFVRGVGEYLPFLPRTFNAALAFWSLNHTNRPEAAIHEVHRVLKPGGRLFLVLEDMEPRWRDVPYFHHEYRAHGLPRLGSTLARKLRCVVGRDAWPLQPDHLRIRERSLARWCAGKFQLQRRIWSDQFLTLELRRG